MLSTFQEKKCTLTNAYRLAGTARSTISDFLGVAELKIVNEMTFESTLERLGNVKNVRRMNGGQHVGRRVGWIGFFTFTQVSIDWIKRFRVCESKQNKISFMELGPGTKYSFAVVKKKWQVKVFCMLELNQDLNLCMERIVTAIMAWKLPFWKRPRKIIPLVSVVHCPQSIPLILKMAMIENPTMKD